MSLRWVELDELDGAFDFPEGGLRVPPSDLMDPDSALVGAGYFHASSTFSVRDRFKRLRGYSQTDAR